MKKYTVILICLLAGAAAASAQQITRFAVVDTSRIYATFLRDSRSVRDYQAKQAKYQAETQRMRKQSEDPMPSKNIRRKLTQRQVFCLSIPRPVMTNWRCCEKVL